MIARKPTDKTLKLPSRTDFTWRSLNFGSDLLHIDYDDAKFCSNCEYIVAVAGYENCTYTLTLTSREASMIRLAPNRPVNVELDTSSIRYFSTMVSSSEADITLSLTPLNTGSADMYVQIYNYSAFVSAGGGDRYPLPDPYNYETYSYTTEGTEDNHIFLPGPHGEEDIIVITVKALSNVRFVMVAASNNRPVILQSGIPQNHFVDLGQNEYFRFFPNTEDDVRITITGTTASIFFNVSL